MRRCLATAIALMCVSSVICAADSIPTTQEAMNSKLDLWGEAALKQPGWPSYEFFEKLLPPLRYVDANFRVYPIALSAPSNPVKVRFVSDGSCINALARQPNYVNETGRPVTFYVGDSSEVFGSKPRNLEGPKYADGYLPIVQLTYRARGATYGMEAFAPVDPELSKFGVVLVKLTLIKASGRSYQIAEAVDKDPASTMPVEGVEAAENVRLSSQPYDEKIEALIEGPELYAIKDNRLRSGNFKSYPEAQNPKNIEGTKIVLAMYPRLIFNPGRGAIIAPLKTGGSAYLAIFTQPAEEPFEFVLSAESYEEQRSKCAAAWNQLLDSGMVVKTPETMVNNAWRGLLIGNYQLIHGDEMRYSQGNQYDKRYIGEGGDAIRAHALWGHPEDAKRLMPAQFVYTRAGLEFHQAAFKLQMLAHYYQLTRDAEAVKALRPMWQKEIDVILNGRQTENGMFPREKYCGDIDTRVFSLNSNANCWRALRDMSILLADIGDNDQAEKLDKIQTEYRKIILDTLAKAIRRDANPPFVPIALSGEENPHDPIWGTTIGSYWNLMIEYVLESGVFTAESETASDILHYVQQNGGLMMGMLRARATHGNYWAHGGRINDLYGMRYALALLERDEPDRALVSFYGKLAQGMTRDTFIGCEGSSIGAVDEFGRQMMLPPNSAANSSFLEQLRYILVQDYDRDDDGKPETLRLLFATPRAWLADGKSIEVKNAPTAFGVLSVIAKSELSQGKVAVEIDLPERSPVKTLLRLRLPDGFKMQSVSAAGKEIKVDGETMDLTGLTGHVSLVAKAGK